MTHAAAEGGAGTCLAELVASLPFATDLGRGQPMEHSIRRARLGLRVADRAGADTEDRIATYYTGLLDGVYCHADANEQAMWFGDDIAVKAGAYEWPQPGSVHQTVLDSNVLTRKHLGDHGGAERQR